MKRLPKQDRNGARTPSDIERKYAFTKTTQKAEEAEKLASSSIVGLEGKVDKIEGMGLSENNFTDAYAQAINDNTENRHTHNNKSVLDNITNTNITNWNNANTNAHTHSNKSVLDGITSTKISNWDSANTNKHTHSNKSTLDNITSTKVSNWDTAKTRTDATSYNLANYKVSGLTILRSSCIKKNNRVVINFVGTITMAANTTTTLFNLPTALQPSATKDFVAFGQSSNNDGYVGYGYVTNGGLFEVRFNQAISSYIRFSFVYDLD